MKKSSIIMAAFMAFITFSAFTKISPKLVSKKTHISFYSHTAFEDIRANNYQAVSAINTQTGDVVFSVPMQSFEFEKALMQKHFNGKKFLKTKEFPKAKLKGKIANISEVNFHEDGEYVAVFEGTLTIKGQTNDIHENCNVTVQDGKVTAKTKFDLTLADYGVAFVKGKPSKNIAKTIEISLVAEY